MLRSACPLPAWVWHPHTVIVDGARRVQGWPKTQLRMLYEVFGPRADTDRRWRTSVPPPMTRRSIDLRMPEQLILQAWLRCHGKPP
jgi:hypothetical protein